MGFWDRLFKGKVFDNESNPNMVCEMLLCGERYILSEFDIGYDHNDASCEYFCAYAVFEEPVGSAIENWITLPSRKESGEVRFYRKSYSMDKDALFEVRFRDASCVRYRRSQHAGVQATTIVMALPAVTMAGEEFEIKR